ncbi:phospholipase D family protein [Variovorax sp. J22P271]|uniref:phospholipase D family protein n=1 Tax=Variovorax davisae TaxID=3053515 RepID=UPI002578F0B3|nr:phospholipase D family protein [Variovorax sp. J22P271]MDM0037056.1 phospholipase D family protein [Variovorax sp. J22P271]
MSLRTALRRPAACLALVFTLGFVGCAELPKNVDRPVSTALAAPASTPLGDLVQQRRGAAGTRHESGFVLLDGPQAAYGSRLALVEGARKTLDLQYYAIHADASTARLLKAVREAAERGVRVRILLDDLHSTGRDAVVMRMALVPNVEMRMFNPLAGARASTLGRLFGSIDDAARIQQRMHNKLFIADNVLAVAGGRNLGDAYFGKDRKGNFIDLDVLVAGPLVRDLSRSFDAYWNNERAYPVQSLVTAKELDQIREQARADAKAERERQAGDASPAGGAPGAPASEVRTQVWDEQPMDLRSADFVWAPALVLADKPGKIPPDGAQSSDAGKAPGLTVAQPGRRPPTSAPKSDSSLAAAADAAADGETVVDGLLQLISQARSDLLVISPYFVPGADMKQAFATARSRGVRIRVLTNSLASNDAPVAHVGYARHRDELLAMGVELYELRSEQAGLGSAFGSGSGTGSAPGASRSMLHSKVLVIDGRLLVVGSMNLDLRSQHQNTEIAVLVRSDALSRAAGQKIEQAMREGAWHVVRSDGRLIWQAPEGSGLENATSEPDTSAGLRALVKLFGPLAPDALL